MGGFSSRRDGPGELLFGSPGLLKTFISGLRTDLAWQGLNRQNRPQLLCKRQPSGNWEAKFTYHI
jgi:hypothetical protein